MVLFSVEIEQPTEELTNQQIDRFIIYVLFDSNSDNNNNNNKILPTNQQKNATTKKKKHENTATFHAKPLS